MTVVEFAGGLRQVKSQVDTESRGLPATQVFQQLQRVVVADISICMSQPELSEIVGTGRSL